MKMTKEKLSKMYYSMTNAEMCEKLGVSNVTLISYIEKAGIQLKGKGSRSKIEII